MKKIGVLILLLVVIFGAGCASKEENNAVNTTSEQQGSNPEEVGINTTEAVQSAATTPTETGDSANAQVSEPTSTETSSQQDNTSAEISQSEETSTDNNVDDSEDTQLSEGTQKYISPELSAMNIVSNDPDISVEKMVLNDNRDYAESTSWDIDEQLKNEGDLPVYLGAYYGEDDSLSRRYYLIQPGESVWINYTYIDKSKYNLTNLPIYYITSCKTVMPEISPEFSNFKLENFNHFGVTAPDDDLTVDIQSVKYVVKDATKGWASLVTTVSAGDKDVSVDLIFTKVGGSMFYGGDCSVMDLHVPAGQTVEAEFPIREYTSPDDFGGVRIYVDEWQ